MGSSVLLWIFSILLLASEYQCQLGLLDSLLGNNQQQGRPLSPFNQRPQYNLPTRRPINNNLDPGTRETLEEQKEKLEDILAKLQEMNKLKEEQRQKEQGTTTQKTVTNTPNIHNNNQNNNNQGTTSPRPVIVSTNKPDVKKGWKKVMTKKFMFQAQPVVPEDQLSNYNMDKFVYYLEQ